MNERLKELAQQCYETGPIGPDGWPEYSRLNEEKFAHLIISECVKTMEDVPPVYIDYRNQIEDRMRNHCIWLIKDKFGVSE